MKLNTTKYAVYSDKLSKYTDGYRLAVLSDLHDTVYGEDNRGLFERINKECPDAVIIAGDLVTAKNGRDFSPALRLLEMLGEKWPVYYALGNHEQRLKRALSVDGINNGYLQSVKNIKGVEVLDNETVPFGKNGEVLITGLSLPKRFYAKGKKIMPDISDITAEIGAKKDKLTILIAHNPIYFPVYAEWGADLVLSGHLHGGIVRLPFIGGVLSPQVSFFPKYDKGRFELGESTMLVSAGLGKHTIPIRLWNPAELVVLELKNKN